MRLAVADQALAGRGERRGEEHPGEHGGEDHEGIGRGAFGGQPGHLAEDHGHDDHRQERLDDGPGDADDGLLVADGDVAPGEDVEQLAVAPEVGPVLAVGPAGLEDQLR